MKKKAQKCINFFEFPMDLLWFSIKMEKGVTIGNFPAAITFVEIA